MKKDNYSFKRACAVVGGQSAMARLLGVSPPSVNQWIKVYVSYLLRDVLRLNEQQKVVFCVKNFVLMLIGHTYDARHVIRRICR